MFYIAYASRIGFSVGNIKSRRSRNVESIIMRRFVYSREGFPHKKFEIVKRDKDKWVASKVFLAHTHELTAVPTY